jgi:hypothetical protein
MLDLTRPQLVTALGAVLLIVLVLELVRRRRLSEEYSLPWVASSVVIAALGFSPPLLTRITHALGARYESSTVFAVGIAFTTGMLVYLSVKLSRLGHEHHALVREVALLRHELEARDRGPAPARAATERG